LLAVKLRQGSRGVGELVTMMEPVLTMYQEVSAKAADAQRHLEQALPQQGRKRLESEAYAVCLAAGKPLSLREIARGVLNACYQSRITASIATLCCTARLDGGPGWPRTLPRRGMSWTAFARRARCWPAILSAPTAKRAPGGIGNRKRSPWNACSIRASS